MDADISRWRSMGASKAYSFPNQKIVLKGRFRDHTSKIKLPKTQKQSNTSNTETVVVREPLGNLFDRILSEQRHDVESYSSGHLNHSKLNQTLQKEYEKTKGKILFGGKYKNEEVDIPPGEMIDILKEFDSVQIHSHSPATRDTSKFIGTDRTVRKQFSKPTRKFLAAPQFSLTKYDHYKAVSFVDKSLIQDGRNMKHADIGKLAKLKEYRDFIEYELTAADCPPVGPNLKRLQIFSTCFEKLIEDFSTHGTLLAEIKKEYDITVTSFQSHEEELTFLRTKVQKLLSQNENRMMLKFEKQKCRELESKIAIVETENSRLKEEMVYKLSVFAAYLPKSILSEEKASFEYGKDPLSVRDKAIAEKDKALEEKMREIEELRRAQEDDFVPRVTKEKIEENLKILEEKFKECVESNAMLENSVRTKKEHIKSLETELREKEQQYQFLVAEYSELSEGLQASKLQENYSELN